MYDQTEDPRHIKFERLFVGLVAIIAGLTVIAVSILGPLGFSFIQHRTTPSGILQIVGQDLTDLLLLGPLSIIGGSLLLMRKSYSKYFLILTPITLIYKGLSYGLGQEYAMYPGNIEQYFVLFLIMVTGGLIIGMKAISLFEDEDAPNFSRKGIKVFVVATSILLFMFFMMWTGEAAQVMISGDTSSGSYTNAPTLFWVIRYLDLGLTIPLGFISLYLLLTRPKSAYPIILLFFGFFITLGTAVNAMGWIQFLSGDPELQLPGLAIFGTLGSITWIGFLYLIKDKIRQALKKDTSTEE